MELMSGFNNDGKKMIPITGLICIVESEKAYGVLTHETIISTIDPASVQTFDHVKQRFDNKISWIPKSQVKDVKLEESNLFPNLVIKFKSKVNPAMTPYKTSISFDMPKWLAEEKGFVGENKGEADTAPTGQESDSSGGW